MTLKRPWNASQSSINSFKMRSYLLLFIVLFTWSCTKKIVQLPETTNSLVTEVLDVSPVYMFYTKDTGDIEFNRRNMISTTNWLVNIDKRLTLKQILPHLKYLQDKRHGDGMHKNKNARNYFSCNNTDLKTLSFIEFTTTQFEDNLSKKDSLIMYQNSALDETQIKLFIKNNSEIVIQTNANNIVKSYAKSTFTKGLDSIIHSHNNRKSILLEYSSHILFQDYIFYKSKLLNYSNDTVKIMDIEFTHN